MAAKKALKVSSGTGRKSKQGNTMRREPSKNKTKSDFFVLEPNKSTLNKKSETPSVSKPTPISWSDAPTKKPFLASLRINLGFIEFAHQGHGKFLYFYRRHNTLKNGVLQITRRTLLVSLCAFFGVVGVTTTLLWKKRQHAMEIAFDDDKRGVGGVGRLESGKVIATSTDFVEELAQFEDDEKMKDQLMGALEEKTESDKAEKRSHKRVQKLKYKVKRGDTLQSVAKKYNVRPESISGSSRLNEFQEISPGQTLSIPTRDGFYYVVKKNERLANILQAHKVTLDKFIAENEHVNIDLLDSGEEIFLPGAKPIRRAEGWLVPVPSRIITSGYGRRSFPRLAFHRGLDLKAFYIPFRAAKSGVVTYSGWLGGYGNAIIVKHDDTYKTLYAHLS
ncbi:MAG TPA: M23 family metallopeptidase, partial [Turneriella sp.]|nr:M23 family metallopeptidase [Turneriella sp.]